MAIIFKSRSSILRHIVHFPITTDKTKVMRGISTISGKIDNYVEYLIPSVEQRIQFLT